MSYLINVDNNVTLVCKINSTLPVLTVLWQRSTDSEIKNITYDTNLIKYGGSKPSVPSLTIKGVHQGDAGNYTCLAANEKGTGKSGTINLNVTGGKFLIMLYKCRNKNPLILLFIFYW